MWKLFYHALFDVVAVMSLLMLCPLRKCCCRWLFWYCCWRPLFCCCRSPFTCFLLLIIEIYCSFFLTIKHILQPTIERWRSKKKVQNKCTQSTKWKWEPVTPISWGPNSRQNVLLWTYCEHGQGVPPQLVFHNVLFCFCSKETFLFFSRRWYFFLVSTTFQKARLVIRRYIFLHWLMMEAWKFS